MKSVKPVDLTKEITRIVEKWDAKVDIAVDQSVAETAKQAKSEIKKHTPRRKGGGSFRKAYFIKTKNKKHKVIGSKEYQLAHLLEDGHKVYTRAKGTKYKIGAKKIGPLEVRKTTRHKGAIRQKPEKTSKYEMFKITHDFADEYIRNDFLARLKKIGRI